jgi:hypothetical protein
MAHAGTGCNLGLERFQGVADLNMHQRDVRQVLIARKLVVTATMACDANFDSVSRSEDIIQVSKRGMNDTTAKKSVYQRKDGRLALQL